MMKKHQLVQKASHPLVAAAAAAGEDVRLSIGQALLSDFSHAPDDGTPSACPSVLHNTSLHVADLNINKLHTCCLLITSKNRRNYMNYFVVNLRDVLDRDFQCLARTR